MWSGRGVESPRTGNFMADAKEWICVLLQKMKRGQEEFTKLLRDGCIRRMVVTPSCSLARIHHGDTESVF